MKKIIFGLLLMASVFVTNTTEAQSTSPRFGTRAAEDNTYRKMTLGYTSITDAAAFDSLRIAPTRFNNIYRVALTDSFRFGFPTVTRCFAGDELTIIASGASGNKVTFTTTAGTTWRTAGTATLSTNARAVLKFIFDGAVWVEVSRVVQ